MPKIKKNMGLKSFFSLVLLIVLVSGCTSSKDPNVAESKFAKEEIIEEGLVVHFSFEEISDGQVVDKIHGFRGDVYGATPTNGKHGNAFYFDGVDDYIRLSDVSHKYLSKLDQGTITFWFNFESILDRQSIMPIFYLGMEDENAKDNIFIIEVGHFEKGRFAKTDPENKRLYSTFIKEGNGGKPFLCIDSGESMEPNRWIHYALVSGENGTNVLLNGENIRIHHNFGNFGDSHFLGEIPNTDVIMFGRGKTSSLATKNFVNYKGYIDELRIYDRPLSQDEIKELM